MSEAELLGRVAAYLLSCWALGLGSWALAGLALPPAARAGVRLLAVLAGQLALTAILVQALGLLGLLSAPVYFAACLGIGAAALFVRRGQPGPSLPRLLGSGFRLQVAAPAWWLGWLGALLLLVLAGRFLDLPRDIDALSLHGPLVVEWVQQGRVSLASHWGYPQCWEYQLAPLFLLLRSDLLAVVPASSGVAALFLAVRELAARLRLPGQAGYLLALLGTTVAVVWRDPFKNDVIFAVALLLGVLAVERAGRARGGGFWLIQLAAFLMLGTKPSGFLYAAAFGGIYFATAGWRRRRGPLGVEPMNGGFPPKPPISEGGSEKCAGPHPEPPTCAGRPGTDNFIPAKAGIQSSPSAAALFRGILGKSPGLDPRLRGGDAPTAGAVPLHPRRSRHLFRISDWIPAFAARGVLGPCSEKGAGPDVAPPTRTDSPETNNVIPAKAGIQSSPSAAALFPGFLGKGAGLWAITLAMQVSAAAVQLRNLVAQGNPIYPVRFRLAGFELFPGPADVSGTSILEHFGQLETWRHFVNGGRIGVGAEWPFLLALLGVAAVISAVKARSRPVTFEAVLPWVALGLWGLFTATPWSCGLRQGSWDYLANGSSLRYAIAPICLGYLAAATVLRRWLGARALTAFLALACPALVFWKWRALGLWGGEGRGLGAMLAVVALVVLAPAMLGMRWRRWRKLAAAGMAIGILELLFFFAHKVQSAREASWMPAYRAVWTEVWRGMPRGSTIAVNLPRPLFRYLLYGPRFENRLIQVDIGKGRRGEIPEEAVRFYVVPPAGGAPLEQMVDAMEARGWRVAARTEDGAGALLERTP